MTRRPLARTALGVGGLVTTSIYVSVALLAGLAHPIATFVVSAAVGASVAFAFMRSAERWLAEAIRPFEVAATKIEEGDLSARAMVAPNEITVTLESAFDRLTASVRQTVGELRSERDALNRILNGMEEGVLLLDDEGNVALMNPAIRAMLLLGPDVVGKSLIEVVRHAELKELLDRARRTGETCAGEIELGGLQPRRLLVRGTSFKHQLEPGDGLLAVFFDVTEVRKLESLRRDFVGNVSHELRTPVTAISSATETLQFALTKDPAAAKRFIDIIERNAARLERLIEDLLDLSRIESRELRLLPERFAFEPFATHLLGMFRERADKKGIALKLTNEPALEVDVDRRALEQVLTNLVDNAVKYCASGSTVVLRTSSEAGAVRIAVEDDGPGIDEKHLPRLFERFYRVDAGRSREMGGTGLGLSIVKHLVESMGGEIDVTSTVGRGTSFAVSLPRHAPRPRSSGDLSRAA